MPGKSKARAEYHKRYYHEKLKNNPVYIGKARARIKEWSRGNKQRIRATHLRYLYGLSQEAYNTLLESQNYKCAICNDALDDSRQTHVDHDHVTNRVRGLLCNGCNTGIGCMKERISTLKGAIEYLEKN